MFNLESYITPILLSYVDKYVKDFKPADAQVSLWGGGVVLHNLVLKTDVLQNEVSLPFTLVSGRIHELLISVPWTKIISEPIVVTIDTIECILGLRTDHAEKPVPEAQSADTQMVEAPPGYMQALVRRIVNNISIRVHHLIVKYVHDDIVLSLNVKHVSIDSAGDKWEPAFADIDQTKLIIRRLVTLDDLTLCLDKTDSDGKIRFYQDPLLYRCQLAFRISTKLLSANTRRASGIDFQLRSEKLAWGVTFDQLQLLLRLVTELTVEENRKITTQTKSLAQSSHLLHGNTSNSAEPTRTASWSEWAWSWVPSWKEREDSFDGTPRPKPPVSFSFSAYLDKVSLVIKVMEVESSQRKRSRSLLELCATHAALKLLLCAPTLLQVKFGIRDLLLKSIGKCSCGHMDINCIDSEPTIYLSRKHYNFETDDWEWPQKDLKAEIITQPDVSADKLPGDEKEPNNSENTEDAVDERRKSFSSEAAARVSQKISTEQFDELWHKMSPIIFLHLSRERSPPEVNTNPYENPPHDFEYSDWDEQSDLNMEIQPIDIRVCMGLIHRLQKIQQIVLIPAAEEKVRPMRKLTVEECDALLDNLPQRRINVNINDFRISVHPWDHSVTERPALTPVVLDVVFPKANLVVTAPLYPHRVCSAAAQLPKDTGPICRGARLNFTASLQAVQVSIRNPNDEQLKPCARIDLRFVTHCLLYPEYFTGKQSVLVSYTIKMREMNISGSSARLHAASQVFLSLLNKRHSLSLRRTTLAKDALEDEDRVTLDITIEDLALRGFITQHVLSHIMTLQAIRATVFHSPDSEELHQAWLFSGPDMPTKTPFVRLVNQWCKDKFVGAVDHFGLWTEPAALCMDPLFIAWLSYKPFSKIFVDPTSGSGKASTVLMNRQRTALSSSSGRGLSRAGSNTEQVHLKPRSVDSSSGPSEKKEQVGPPQQAQPPPLRWWQGDNLLKLHERLRKMPITMELGLMLVYVTTKTASAVNCATVRVALEEHASNMQGVMVFSIGRWSLHANSVTTQMWHSIDHDGPTYLTQRQMEETKTLDSFPWKMSLADMSCYSLEAVVASDKGSATNLRSQLKETATARLRTILELVTTTVILSVETKSVQHKSFKKSVFGKDKVRPMTKEEMKVKYFTSGNDFKPTTLKEFLRGPLRHKEDLQVHTSQPLHASASKTEGKSHDQEVVVTTGPMVSLGFNLHADTPPIVLKIEYDQVHLVAACLHCFTHVITLIQQSPGISVNRWNQMPSTTDFQKSLTRQPTDADEVASLSESIRSEERSDITTIFQAHPDVENTIKTFFWCQWVIGRATLVVATQTAKIALDVDDIITTVDLQELYNQMKIKIASTTIKQYEKSPDGQWTTGPLGGRVLEAREPEDIKEDCHFMSLTMTQTQISSLPSSWKAELHPKLMDNGPGECDTMWEIYAVIAPLEVVILPRLLDNVMSIANSLTMQSFCSLTFREERKVNLVSPFCYVNSGGLRLFLACDMPDPKQDDTFVLRIDKISVNPHPDNPICRRPVAGSETGWSSSMPGNLEGRQYEVLVDQIFVQSTRFADLVSQEVTHESQSSVGENPAHKWSQQIPVPVLTTILHPMSISFVFAPLLFVKGIIICGSGFELNLTSDCSLELSVEQLHLAITALRNIERSLRKRIVTSNIQFKDGVCPYATLVVSQHTLLGENASDATILDEMFEKSEPVPEQGLGNVAQDSGVETATSRSTLKSSIQYETPLKKSTSVSFSEKPFHPSEYLEIFVTMGIIDISLYAAEDGSKEIRLLKLRPPRPTNLEEENVKDLPQSEDSEPFQPNNPQNLMGLAEATTTLRKHYVGRIPLLHMKLYQPNLYYWKRKAQINAQVSLFNTWIGLGSGGEDSLDWNCTVLNTARGLVDPDTEIPPALLTMKYMSANASGSFVNLSLAGRGTLNVDIERPIMLELSMYTLERLTAIIKLLKRKILNPPLDPIETPIQPVLYTLRRSIVRHGIDAVTIQTSQIGLSVSEGTMGFESMSTQVAWGGRPESLVIRGLMHGLVISCGYDPTHRTPIMQPVHIGILIDAIWEAWRRAEGPFGTKEPTIFSSIDFDRVNIDLQPDNISLLNSFLNSLNKLSTEETKTPTATKVQENAPKLDEEVKSPESENEGDTSTDHYYKDDLRSGAFKILSGSELPMAYQVMLGINLVSWRYPHPRAITRLVVYPLPHLEEELDCVLECFNRVLGQWEPHTYVQLPVQESREIALHVQPPEAVFSSMWRFRVLPQEPDPKKRYFFDLNKFLPKSDPVVIEPEPEFIPDCDIDVSSEQLSGVLRVDSYFATQLAPRIKVTVRLADLQIHAHNLLPSLPSHSTALEGYYVSKALQRSHRMLSLIAKGTYLRAQLGSRAGSLFVFNAEISSEVMDCSTGTMDSAVEPFQVQAGVSIPDNNLSKARGRFNTSSLVMSLHIPRLRTLQCLAADWTTAIEKCFLHKSETHTLGKLNAQDGCLDDAAKALEGRLSLWIHNTCSVGFRMGQEDTDEVVHIGPGVTLAYRWRKRCAPKRLRFALTSTADAEWHWSKSIPFVVGEARVRLEKLDNQSRALTSLGECLYVEVKQVDAHRNMRLSGRLLLANMLRLDLNYKVRIHTSENVWQSLATGQMAAEQINQSVTCSPSSELVLKVKFMRQNTGWSGDIPLKECPKENVPWLVKVPSEGDMPYMSVWCRVVRARSDGRIIATIWPLYILHSDLTLDTDMLLTTSIGVTSSDVHTDETAGRPPPIIQTALGRGTSTHLIAPGTTSARHNLSFQYKNIECPVTRDAVALHYGVTEKSVFDKRVPVNSIDEIIQDLNAWLARSGRNAVSAWPYSLVVKHWAGNWHSALLQPRCEVVVRYEAVVAGGGCSLEVLLSPVLLLCNASPISLTLRAHDAAPVCKLEPGSVISPPSVILRKPFFMSIEIGRDTFVSEELEVYSKEPGRYGTPPEGKVAVDHPIVFALQCSNKVALLNLHYEIKGDINILGVTSTYVLKNNLTSSLMVAAVAVPNDKGSCGLQPTNFKVIQSGSDPLSNETFPLSQFWLRERWRGGKVSELQTFLCLALEPQTQDLYSVPVRLGTGATRTAISLLNTDNKSVPVVVTQHKHEGQWVVTVSEDPCPQFLIYNQTKANIAVGLPAVDYDVENKLKEIQIVSDCPGARWWCIVRSLSVAYYSSPDHCVKRPPPTDHHIHPVSLCFAKVYDEDIQPEWFPPTAITDGEQLLQLDKITTVKIRVKNNPHSSLIEFREVAENDLSASDIRRRLMGITPIDSMSSMKPNVTPLSSTLQRPSAIDLFLNYKKTELQQTSLALKRALKEARETHGRGYRAATQSLVEAQSKDSKTEPIATVSSNIDLMANDSRITLDKINTSDNISLKIEKQLMQSERGPKSGGKALSFFGLPGASSPEDLEKYGDDGGSATTTLTIAKPSYMSSEASSMAFQDEPREWDKTTEIERIQCIMAGIVVKMATANDTPPLLALHIDNIAVRIFTSHQKLKTNLSVENIQIDNLQYDSGQFDFAVIATTQAESRTRRDFPATCNIFADPYFFAKVDHYRIILRTCHDRWTIQNTVYNELTEVELQAGPLALYVEDAYVKALAELFRVVASSNKTDDEISIMSEASALQKPLRLRLLYIHPLDLTLTLHTAVRIYIALDQSPLHLSAFKIHNMFTSPDRLAHALTVHYLSAAILGAGWVVGGLELLGAPGALAARVGGATGGVRGIASAAAAALLRSLSAWAGSLARNLDLLAGDEEHARRAAAARRRPPDSFMAGLMAGITNFAINILGAVGGLAHHPLVGVAVGESESGTTALRRGLLGALTKPLSATADLVAYAGNGLLKQTGWDPVPQPRSSVVDYEAYSPAGWRRDCVRWTFRLADFNVYAGFEVLLDNIPLQLMLTHKFVLIGNPENECVTEMIDLRYCKLGPCQGSIVELYIQQHNPIAECRTSNKDEEMEQQARAAVMARVARYMGTEGASTSEARVLFLLPMLGEAYSLHAALATAIRNNSETHFCLM